MWPQGKSFNDQLKWFQSTKIPIYKNYADALKKFSFDNFFIETRNLRTIIKTAPHHKNSDRMFWKRAGIPKLIKDNRRQIGSDLHKLFSFTDFVGDYLLIVVSSVKPLYRMEFDHNNYPVGVLSKEEIETYKWFNS